MNKIRILYVLGNTGRGGSQGYAINILRHIDKNQFEIDFAVYEEKENGYSDEIRKLGCNIWIVPKFNGFNLYKCLRRWEEIYNEGSYNIIHGHATNAAFIYLRFAKKLGIKTIIHSHSSGFRGNWLQRAIKASVSSLGPKYADYWFACSDKAAKKLYNQKYKNYSDFYLIPNAIDVAEYRFERSKRELIRQRYNIKESIKVIGHLGSFSTPKNHNFLIDLFQKIHSINQNSVLLLCGDGPLLNSIRRKVKRLNLGESVIFTGNIPDVAGHLMAMDIMVFPSIFEGLPVSLVEAQATGLPIVKSDRITDEVDITDLIVTCNINDSYDQWCKIILSISELDRQSYNNIVYQTNFNIRQSIHLIQSLYIKLYNYK